MRFDFLRQVLSSLAIRIFAAVAAYLSVLFLGRWLSIEDFGLFATVLSSVLMVMTVIALGVPMSLLRAIGEYKANKRMDLLRPLLRRSTRYPLYLAFFLAAIGSCYSFFYVYFQAEGELLGRPFGLLASFMLLPFYLMAELNASVLRSFGYIVFALGPRDVLWRFSLIPIGFFVAHTFGPGEQFLPLLFVSIAVLGLLVIGQLFVLNMSLKKLVPDQVARDSRGVEDNIWGSVKPLMRRIWVTNVSAMGLANIDVIAISVFISPEVAGPYFLASRTAGLVSFTLNAVGLAIGPRIASAHFSGDLDRLRSELAIGALISFAPAVLTFFLLAVFGRHVLALAGEEFGDFYVVLIVLALGHLFKGVNGSSGILLNMTGNELINARISSFSIVFAVVAISVGGYLSGVIGISLGLAFTMIVVELSVYVSCRVVTGYDATVVGLIKLSKSR